MQHPTPVTSLLPVQPLMSLSRTSRAVTVSACGLVEACTALARSHLVRRPWPGFVIVVGVCDRHHAMATRLGYTQPPDTLVTLFCTWDPACPNAGTLRVERDGGHSGVEFVCPSHAPATYAAGYRPAGHTGPTP